MSGLDCLVERLVAHLSDGSSTKGVKSVEIAGNLLEKFGLTPKLFESNKDESGSENFRITGNELYKKGKLTEALKFYTKSIGAAEMFGKNLALAYANRSAVLYELKLYKECLEDIQRALNTNKYPKDLQEKLFRRRMIATKNLQKPTRQQLPKIINPNSTIKSASDCIEMKSSPTMGRHIVATSDLDPGTLLAVERPFVAVPEKSKRFEHCDHCLKLTLNPIPCEKCPKVFYCNDNCRISAWKSYHEHECRILESLVSLTDDVLTRLALRVSLAGIKELPTIKEGILYESGRYKEIDELVTNSEKRDEKDLSSRAVKAAVLFYFLKNQTKVLEECNDENTLQILLFRHLQTGPCNFHTITQLTGSQTIVYEIDEIGSGAFSFLSLLNHSCDPNVMRHCYDGSTIVLRTLRFVRKGEQIYDNYGYHYAVMEREKRRKELEEQYFFKCECDACLENWPMFRGITEHNGFDVTENEMNGLQFGYLAVQEIDGLILKCVEFLKRNKDSKPTGLQMAQEVLKQCYGLLANRKSLLSCKN